MNCPNCNTVNPESARFCTNCGTALVIPCANCGTALAPGAKFCHKCGTPVGASKVATFEPSNVPTSEPALDPALARLQQYIPKELLNKLETARTNRSMEGERRIVTVLFCDVKGSTALAESMDPEEWAEIMNGAFKYLIEPIYKYEGTLARLMGDAILAFFGAPITHEDDPQRAVLAGLGIIDGMMAYREQVQRDYGLELNVRVGINTGLVVVGEVGSDLRVEYTAIGDAVNVAARMEQTAEPDTVLISANTYKSVANLFDFESLGGVEVKGKSEPIEIYRVIGARAGAVPTRGIEGLSSPLVGRERELQTLQSKINDLQEGCGQIISLIGEAGLGKSRLLAELKLSSSRVADDNLRTFERSNLPTWLEGRSLSYESTTPYAPFIDLFTACFDLRPDDSDDENYRKIEERVEEILPGQAEEIAPFLATVLDIELPREAAARVKYLEPPQLRGRIFQATQTFFAGLAAKGPVVLIFEDLHWVDPTSLELVEQLLPLVESSPVAIIALFRPNTQDASWGFHETAARDYAHLYTQIMLQPLDDASSRELVANLLEIEDLPEKVRALVLAKAEGNPFFVEEVIRSLLDAKLVVREDDHWRATREIENIAVPDTLAGVITARLDRLDDESKHVAQTAAVVGREFQFDILQTVYEAPQELDGAVSNLQRRELVREKSRIPRRAYLFKHVLTQETAYASVLLSKRRDLHLRVGECIERTEPERVNDLARHFLEARQTERALPYLVEAGDRAARAASRQEAIGYYRRALDILQTIENPALARRAYEGLGKTLMFSMDLPGAMEAFHQMLHYAEDHGDARMKVSALNKMSYLNAFMMGQFPEAELHLGDAEGLAREHNDLEGLAELATVRCGICTITADFDTAVKHLNEAVQVGKDLAQTEVTAYALAHKANTLTYMTKFDEAWETAQEGLRVAEENNVLDRKAEILSFPVPLHYMCLGDLDAAYQAAEEGYRIASKIGGYTTIPIVTSVLASIAEMKGEYESSLEWSENGVQAARPLIDVMPFFAAMQLSGPTLVLLEISPKLAEQTVPYYTETRQILETPGGAPAAGSAYADLGFSALIQGRVEDARTFFQQGLDTQSTQMYMQRPRLLAGSALSALAANEPEKAQELTAEARRYAEERSMKYFYPLLEFVEGHLEKARGEMQAALDHFTKAETLALEMRMRPIVWQSRMEASHALAALGSKEKADKKAHEARDMINEIASIFRDEENCKLFTENAMGQLG